MRYDNDDREIVEHQINKLELINDPYPYERFETYHFSNPERNYYNFIRSTKVIKKW